MTICMYTWTGIRREAKDGSGSSRADDVDVWHTLVWPSWKTSVCWASKGTTKGKGKRWVSFSVVF